MWFRLSGGNGNGSGSAGSGNDSIDATGSLTPPDVPTPSESKFQKFRRSSFRRKQTPPQLVTTTSAVTATTPNGSTPPPSQDAALLRPIKPRRRSKSPHSILSAERAANLQLKETNEDEEQSELMERKDLLKSRGGSGVETIGSCGESPLSVDETDYDAGEIYRSVLTIPLSVMDKADAKLLTKESKKQTLKMLKNEQQQQQQAPNLAKKKTSFYKSFRSKQRQSSTEDEEKAPEPPTTTQKLERIEDATHDRMNSSCSDDDDDDSESDSEDDTNDDHEDVSVAGKEKILLTDPKFKNNRIEKSSSKTKVNDATSFVHQRRESLKRSRSARKISAPPILVTDCDKKNDSLAAANSKAAGKKNKKDKTLNASCIEQSTKDDTMSSKPKHTRAHSNLNLQALVKFVMNNKKFLSTDDFALTLRRKSISEAASSVIAAAAIRPRPIALKFGGDVGIVADAPHDCDAAKTDKNVVLVKKQNLKNSFCEPGLLADGKKTQKCQRNGSNSSKSSGICEDEDFYSLDEQESPVVASKSGCGVIAEIIENVGSGTEQKTTKSFSPSLTSRVAAKINETTNIYKNRKAAHKSSKKRKAAALAHNGAGKRAELYKQISVERLHSSSIVRQPSDRRPDANASIRSNGNASANSSVALNNSDLQSSFHGTSANESASTNIADTSAGSGAGGHMPPPNAGPCCPGGMDINAQDATGDGKDARRERYHQHPQHKSAPVSVNRSESYKERLSNKRNRNSRRKTSDPSLTSRPNDDQPDLGLSNSNYTASSNSSLSSGGGSESPSTSMEQVGGAAAASAAAPGSAAAAAAAAAWHHHTHGGAGGAAGYHTHQHSHGDSFHGSVGSSNSNNTSFWGGQPLRQWNFESDEEDDLKEADWSSMVAAEMLAALTDAEKKRQEIINEIYQTERSHVRTLKLLDRLFFCPLFESGLLSQDHLMLLFPPALLSLRELHGSFEQKLKLRRVEHNHIVNHIGDLLAGMFDGHSGDELCEHAAQFCARQQIALEALKEKRRKDEQLQKLLSKSESHKACRRLQLKDLLPTVLQRLTKYPLLFENLYKVTLRVVPENTTEAEAIQRALESSKKILVEVNQAVKTAEDAHKLQNIQRKLDKSTFDKDEFKNLDLTQYRLIHDGNLTMKKNQSIQLHGLLFENMIVLLTKQDDKYSLKYLHTALAVNNKPVNPIMSIDSETLVRQEAADKNSFFLIKTKTSQMLELRAPSSSECKTWFKHISDAAEQYKPRSKSNTNNHEHVDDPAIATIPHSNTKESLEPAPERPPPMSATATVTTTPLAPMLPMATVTPAAGGGNNNNSYNDVQLRNGRRESTPTSSSDNGGYYNLVGGKQRLSHNELSTAANAAGGVGGSSLAASAVNRTMSTRSCGEANNNSYDSSLEPNGVTLRHTQSARQANGGGGGQGSASSQDDGASSSSYSLIGGSSKRDSASIVCSNNSNNTRTLLMQSPLVEPTAIQISISPAHTAEPVLTPNERLRRLDASIRDGLLEKQKIICDMFRLPVEHFHEIVDIAAMPEAPKDSADIALAAYDQVQSLTKVLNEYMQVTPEQEISAVSTAVCDHCHEKQQQHHSRKTAGQSASGMATTSTPTIIATVPNARSETPPPLPPPNKQPAQQQTPAKNVPKMQTPPALEDAVNIHEDDDGYCEIDELRLPAVPMPTKTATGAIAAAATPLATFKVPAPTTSAAAATPPPTSSSLTTTVTATSPTPELVKRQSTISADSIPEESADEVSKALDDNGIVHQQQQPQQQEKKTAEVAESTDPNNVVEATESEMKKTESEEQKSPEAEVEAAAVESIITTKTTSSEAEPETPTPAVVDTAEGQHDKSTDSDSDLPTEMSSEFLEINDVYDTLAALNKAHATLSMIDNSTQTAQLLRFPLNTVTGSLENGNGSSNKMVGPTAATCGPNRIQHANSLEPSVPCYALSNIVSALNEQISLLLPKINERDMERERLRKENQHLRELLSAMHERQRVEAKGETPTDIKTILSAADEAFDDEIDSASNASVTPTPTTPTALSGSDAATPVATTATSPFKDTTSSSTKSIEAEN